MLRIAGLTTCVGYAEHLERSLARWRHTLDDLIVLTTPDDQDTIALCVFEGVRVHQTDAFTRDPRAIFDKARAMDEGLVELAPRDWVLFIDADVVPPENWRKVVEGQSITPGMLYGARRRDESGRLLADGELAGFFQLWHSSDPKAQDRPLLGSWRHAGSYDSAFVARWPSEQQRILPLTLTHHGTPGKNWCGVGRADLLDRAMAERQQSRLGWLSERLDR